jgi:hypothetical protein
MHIEPDPIPVTRAVADTFGHGHHQPAFCACLVSQQPSVLEVTLIPSPYGCCRTLMYAGKDTVAPQVVKPETTAAAQGPLTPSASAPAAPAPPAAFMSSASPVIINGSIGGCGSPAAAAAPSTPSPAGHKSAGGTSGSPQSGTAAAAAAKSGPKINIDDARAAWQPKPRIPVRLINNYINFLVIGERPEVLGGGNFPTAHRRAAEWA